MRGLSCFVPLLLIVGLTESLDPYKFYEEGPCSRIRYHPEPIHGLNRQFLDSLRYIQEGNKYQIYRLASQSSKYDKLYDDELSRDFCLQRNISSHTDSSVGSYMGFGSVISTFQTHVAKDQPGLYFEAIPRDGLPSWDKPRHYITLTDNKKFAVEVICWTGSNQVGWVLLSGTPYIDENIRRLAMDHASHMGFDSRNFISLQHDRCGPEDLRNTFRYQAADNYEYLRHRAHPDTRIGIPYQNSYVSVGYAAQPGHWPSRPIDINYHSNYDYGNWQQRRYRQQYK